MKTNFVLLIVLIMIFLGFSSSALAADDFGVTLPNPLCLTGSTGTCNPECDGTGWEGRPNNAGGFGYPNFAACCAEVGAPITGDTGTCVNDFPSLIGTTTGYITTIVGSLLILMLVWAGVLFVTSAGNPGQVEKAKKVILYAIIGAAIVLAGTGLVAAIKAVIPGG